MSRHSSRRCFVSFERMSSDHCRSRARIGDDRFYDLHYVSLLSDPVAEMRALYEWAGDPLTPAVERRMHDWFKRNPQHKFGRPSYELARFRHQQG